MRLAPFQVEGAKFLVSKRYALLADEPGLGKTLQVLAAIRHLQITDPMLIVAPACMVCTWATYVTRVLGVSPIVNPKALGDGVNILSYDRAVGIKQKTKFKLGLVVADEAHYLKNRTAKRTKALLGKFGFIAASQRFWAVTGTPISSLPTDVFPIAKAFGATYLDDFHIFERIYCTGAHTPWGFKATGAQPERVNDFKAMLAKFMLRRTKAEAGIQLPEFNQKTIYTPCGAVDVATHFPALIEEYKSVNAADKKLLAELTDCPDTLVTYEQFLEMQGHLMHVLKYSALSKIKATTALANELLDQGKQVIIFSMFTAVLDALKSALDAEIINGNVSSARRQALVTDFQNGKIKIIVANIIAAGVGLTLTASHNIIFNDLSYSPDANLQAANRAHRIGQTEDCICYYMTVPNSIDEQVNKILLQKERTIAKLI